VFTSIIFPGHKWEVIIAGKTEEELTVAANARGAVTMISTVNMNGDWVLWAYVLG
jgi:hypothetical protein